jgi:hypothetical protein
MRSRISRARGMTRFGRSAMISTPMSVIAAPTIIRRSSRSPSALLVGLDEGARIPEGLEADAKALRRLG